MEDKYLNSSKKMQMESKTASLFPRIHSNNTMKDIEAYELNSKRVFCSYFNDEIEHFFAKKTSLEVGCGGRCSGINLLSKFGLDAIYAIDLSSANVLSTQVLCNQLGIANAVVEQGNALAIQHESGKFDFVMSDGVIHHTLDTKKAFLEITRVLKPGGVIFLGIYGYGGLLGLVFPLGKYLGKFIPYRFMLWLVNKTGFLRSQEYSILDWLYTPIQRNYRASTIESWLEQSRYTNIVRVKSNKWFFNMGILSSLLFGKGYLYFFAKKGSI